MKLVPLEPSTFYHFFNRGNNNENIFLSDGDKIRFLKLLKKYIIPIADIYGYCLMENHFHLIVKIKKRADLPFRQKEGVVGLHQPFSNWFNAYVKGFNKSNNRVGSLFQKHPKRIVIDTTEYLRNLIIYVNTNTDKHGVMDFREYRFSSYQALFSDKPTAVVREQVIELFDDIQNLKSLHEKKKMDLKMLDEIVAEDW